MRSYHSFDGKNRPSWRSGKNGNGKFIGRNLICEIGWDGVSQRLGLSHREFQIAQLLFDDMNESEIADALGISRHTVHTHLERLYRKTSVTSRLQLVLHVVSQYMSLCDYPECDGRPRNCPVRGRLAS